MIESIGPYRILAKIGEGGMGEVYRATDTNLKRGVAIKVLPASVAGDPHRVARFQREAEVLAALNHPNIAHIHGLEKSNGTVALIMELVEGPTLADRIARGPIPLQEALAIAKQITEALEAAHDQGIVHRDLKPANIKVRDDGKVKVLDFGLAKAMDPVGSRSDVSQSPTRLRPGYGEAGHRLRPGYGEAGNHLRPGYGEAGDRLRPGYGEAGDRPDVTEVGTILGTAAYMSPEQARAQAVDKRADVWAFGCVLYEMLTGRAPFARETVSDSLAAILERDPDWALLPGAMPAGLPRLLARCLAKDRQQRLRDVGDARLEIDEWLASPSPTAPIAKPAQSRTSRRLAAIVTLTAAAGLVTGFVLSRYSSSQPPGPTPVRFTIAVPPGYEVDLNGTPVGVSGDGRTIAFAATRGSMRRIYLRDLDKIEATPVPGTDGGFAPFFSPDGQWIGFFANQKLRKVLRAGGTPVTIADFAEFAGNRTAAASWDDQDTIFFTPDVTKGIWRTSAAGGTPTAVTTPTAGESFHIWPQLLPGGKALLFSAVGDDPDPQAFVQRLDTGERKPLLRGLGTRYVPTGHLLFVQGGSLMAVRFDLARLEITGPAVAVAADIAEPVRLRVTPNGLSRLFYVSPTGTIVFLSADRPPQDALFWVDRSGRETPVGVSGGTYAQPRVSPDGRRIALVARGGDTDDIWLYDLSRNTLGRVTTEGNNGFPIWSRDGSRLIYSSDRTGSVSIESKQPDASGVGDLLVRSERAIRAFPFSWSPEGVLAFVWNDGTQHVRLLRPGQEATPFFTTPFIEGAPMFAPDGRAIAYVSNETGRNEIYIRPFPGPGEKLTVTNEGGNEPLWAPSGRELFYRNGDAIMAVDVTTSPALTAGTPRKLFEKRYEPTFALYANYSISPDGQRFVMVKRISEGESPAEIKVAVHWFDELNTRVSPK